MVIKRAGVVKIIDRNSLFTNFKLFKLDGLLQNSLKRVIVITILTVLFTFSVHAQDFIQKELMHDGIQREYMVYIPSIYDSSIKVPLVLNFHGFGTSNYSHYRYYSDMTNIADTANFILVYPQGAAGSDGYPHWNIESDYSKSDIDDLGFTSIMIDSLVNLFSIDTLRVYATGFSNGAFFTYDLGCRLADKIAAIAPVAGTMPQVSFDECDATKPTSVISFHGTADNDSPYNGIQGYNLSYDEINEFWSTFNETDIDAKITEINTNNEDGSSVELYSWENGINCSSVNHYKIIDGGHSWPNTGTQDSGKGNDGVNKDIDANNLIWNFMAQYNLHGRLNCNEVTNSDEEYNLKHYYNLKQNYPNPFNPNTLISFSLARNENVSLEVFNLQGRSVVKLIDESLHIGEHSVHFNARNLSSGVYFYKLSTPSFIKTKKMLLIK